MPSLLSVFFTISIGIVLCGCDPNSRKSDSNELRNAIGTAESETINTASNVELKKRMKFSEALESALVRRSINRKEFCDANDAVQVRVLNEYGAMFLATADVAVPSVCMFQNSAQVKNYQDRISIAKEDFGDAQIELQAGAMKALLEAKRELQEKNLTLTPRDGAEAARRSFEDTVRLWNSRFEPACEHWIAKKRLKIEEVANLKALPINEQVREVLKLEEKKIYFNTFFNNSILYSVAAPGTSQHLSMLAFDAEEFQNEKVRKILGDHGWFRTVKNDAPHFTYLGLKKDELKRNGLKKIVTGDGEYWIPNI